MRIPKLGKTSVQGVLRLAGARWIGHNLPSTTLLSDELWTLHLEHRAEIKQAEKPMRTKVVKQPKPKAETKPAAKPKAPTKKKTLRSRITKKST